MSSVGNFSDSVVGKGRVLFSIFGGGRWPEISKGIRIHIGESGQAAQVGKDIGESCLPKNDFVQKKKKLAKSFAISQGDKITKILAPGWMQLGTVRN